MTSTHNHYTYAAVNIMKAGAISNNSVSIIPSYATMQNSTVCLHLRLLHAHSEQADFFFFFFFDSSYVV